MNKRKKFSHWLHKKHRLSLRLRLALWSAGLILLLSFFLLLFVNYVALDRFPRIIAGSNVVRARSVVRKQVNCNQLVPFACQIGRPENALERALLLELRNISLLGLVLVAVTGGVAAYWFAGIALRPLRRVSEASKRISAQTLHTRLALDGPNDEVKELADTFDAMLGRLEQTFALQNRFVADVAHELRTPLSSLRINLEVVAADEDTTLDDYRQMVATQERALTRLEHLMADLLLLATNKSLLSEHEIALGPLLEETLVTLKPLADAAQVTLRRANETDVVVHGNEQLLARAFSNLIENGIYYNHTGGEVVIQSDCKEGWAIVTVSDTGIGIPEEQQASIFDRFYRVDRSRSRHKGGAGLGLSIVEATIQHHGGSVHVASTPGKGSVFTVLLPL